MSEQWPDKLNQLRNRKRHILGHEQRREAAVLVPLIRREQGLHVLFQVRAAHLKHQPGDISFPGGKKETVDQDFKATAIRETCEEIGVFPSSIEIIAPLDVMVPPHQTLIYPYVGLLSTQTEWDPDPNEVEEVFEVPLAYFFEHEPQRYDVGLKVEPPADFPYHLIVGGENYDWRGGVIEEYFYIYQDYVIWGMTARILLHFIQLLKDME